MNLPRFTAEASLYQTNGHYQTGRQAIKLPTETIRAIYPAVEVIEIHSCPPGYTDIGGSCWPDPLTEPSGGGGGSTPGVPSGGPGEDRPGGGGGRPPKRVAERPKTPKKSKIGPHNFDDNCTRAQVGSIEAKPCVDQLYKDFANKVPKENWPYLVCEGSEMGCCKDYDKGTSDEFTICDEL